MADERWLPVAGFEGYYEVSDHGRVRSVDRVVTFKDGVTKRATRGRLLTLSAWNGAGNYLSVPLCKGGKTKKYGVHRLVATAFSERRVPEGPQLAAIMSTMSKRYGVRFEFCSRRDTARRICELLGVEVDQG